MQDIDIEALKRDYETASNPKAKLKLGQYLIVAYGDIGAFDDIIRLCTEMLPIAENITGHRSMYIF